MSLVGTLAGRELLGSMVHATSSNNLHGTVKDELQEFFIFRPQM